MTSDLSPEQLTRVFACGIGGLEAGLIVNTGARLSLTPTAWRPVLAAVGLGVLLVTVAGVPLVLTLLSLRARGVLPEHETSRGVWASVWAPANLAHEATHALVALVLGVKFDLVRRDDGRLGIDLAIDETVPVWGVVLASLAPTLVGGVLGAMLLPWILGALSPAVGVESAVGRLVVGVSLVRFGWPSRADLEFPAFAVRYVVAKRVAA